MTTAPDPNSILLGPDPVPACATAEQRALLEWAEAHKIDTPHPGMTKDGGRYSAPAPGEDKAKARTRITTFVGGLDDGEGLIDWRHRILIDGVLISDERIATLRRLIAEMHRREALDIEPCKPNKAKGI